MGPFITGITGAGLTDQVAGTPAEFEALEDLDTEADRLADLAELAQIDYEAAAADLQAARIACNAASDALAAANMKHSGAADRAVAERRRLGVMRAADGSYRTVAQVRNAARAAERAGLPVADAEPKTSYTGEVNPDGDN